MPILKNQRHELFAQELAKGKSASEAYGAAGFRPCRQNAARLMTNDDIQARVAEMQTQAAKKSEVTVESLLDELEHARQRADGLDQLSAAVKAISEKIKLSGLLVQRVEVGGPGAFDRCETVADVADEMIAQLVEHFRPVDEQDRQGLVDLLERQSGETQEYLAAIRARPVIGVRCEPTNSAHPLTNGNRAPR